MKTRNKSQAERAILFAAAVGGLSRDKADELMAESGFEPVNPSSWDMVLDKYVPHFEKHPELLGWCILKPMSITDLKKASKDLDEKSPT